MVHCPPEDPWECVFFPWIGSLISFPIIGLVCTIVGAIADGRMTGTPWLLSIPLCPTGTFPYSEYIGDWIPESGVCSSGPAQFRILFPLSQVENRDTEQTVFLVHNLWNYQISVGLCSDSCENPPFLFNHSRTDGAKDLESLLEDDLLPSDLIGPSDHVRVFCPNSSLPSRGREPAPVCQDPSGAWYDLDGLFEKLEVGKVKYSGLSSNQTSVVFRALTVTPRDFIEAPQMYWFSEGKAGSMNDVLITGIVFFTLTGILVIGSVVGLFIILAMLPGDD
jgi:hypothetical protein